MKAAHRYLIINFETVKADFGMNERIKQFAEQARDWGYAEHSGYTAQLLFEQKFAGLIVRECITNVEVWEKDSRNHISYLLKQHFGVKE